MFSLAQIRHKFLDFEKSGCDDYMQINLCHICANLKTKQAKIDTNRHNQIKGGNYCNTMICGVI